MNFFALTSHRPPQILRIPLTADLQADLTAFFRDRSHDLVDGGLEVVPFDGRLTADESQVLAIRDFTPPESIWNALRTPMSCAPLTSDALHNCTIKAIITGSAGEDWASFQAFDRTRLLQRRGISIVASGQTFRRLAEPGLTISDTITAHYREGELRFRSFAAAKRVLDLSRYYREATDPEIAMLFISNQAVCSDQEAFLRSADSWIRRKLGFIRDTGILANLDPERLTDVAQAFDVRVQYQEIDGRCVVVFPDDKRELKQLLRLLDEDYYEAPLTGRKYVSNSKRILD